MVNMGPLLNTKFCTSRIDDKSKSLGKVFEQQHECFKICLKRHQKRARHRFFVLLALKTFTYKHYIFIFFNELDFLDNVAAVQIIKN